LVCSEDPTQTLRYKLVPLTHSPLNFRPFRPVFSRVSAFSFLAWTSGLVVYIFRPELDLRTEKDPFKINKKYPTAIDLTRISIRAEYLRQNHAFWAISLFCDFVHIWRLVVVRMFTRER